jgi:hypothetical protein
MKGGDFFNQLSDDQIIKKQAVQLERYTITDPPVLLSSVAKIVFPLRNSALISL